MAASVWQIKAELFVEERIARLEANVEHIQADVSEIKADIRRLDIKIDDVKDSVNALRVEMKESIASLRVGRMLDRIWWLLIAGAMLSVMARGFKWI